MRPRGLRTIAVALVVGATPSLALGQHFSADETAEILRYWAEPGRYRSSVPKDFERNGIWQVRLTVEGSTWLWGYDRLRGKGKAPTTAKLPEAEVLASWERWVDAKVARDRAAAQLAANQWNEMVIEGYVGPKVEDAPDPGPVPASLLAFAGNPPTMANAVVPMHHEIVFAGGEAIVYMDNPKMQPRYAYYRWPEGVQSFGSRVADLKREELDAIFLGANIGASDQKVMLAVSPLEGGFDSVNTYDTGFVSVGFIQFASLKEGGHSLGRVLARMKAASPDAFHSAFRRYGLEVTPDAKLVALDLATGAEAVGPDANLRIIRDKRLIAVFQLAGRTSREFRSAQVQTAYASYFPGDDVVSIQSGAATLSLRVRDFIRSEAGLATLMDRKVNTGTLEPLPFILATIAGEIGATKPEQFARYERDIVAAMKFRKDFLREPTLSQPGPAAKPGRDYRQLASRKGSRGGRGKP